MSVNIHVETASGCVAGNSARKGSTSSAATSRLHHKQDLAQHGAHLRFKNFIEDPQTKGRRDATGQLADAAEHHHQE